MPACLTHYFFSQNVREDLKDKAELDPCAYAWGAQGPDFFFCHRFLPGPSRSRDPILCVGFCVPLLFRLYRPSLHQLAGSRACKAAPLGDPLYHARGD